MGTVTDSSQFGRRLKSLRKRKGLTQQELAQIAGCARGYISSLETGSFSPSMRILRQVSAALNVQIHELLLSKARDDAEVIPLLNTVESPRLVAPKGGRDLSGNTGQTVCLPGVLGREAFALFLPDDSMAPSFDRGDLVVFSLARSADDSDPCLVDTGKGEVVFRTVLALPGRRWRLQPSNPKFEPRLIKAGRGVRMWPAIGRWQMLAYGRGR